MGPYEVWIQGGATGLLILIIVGGWKALMNGNLVLGREYMRVLKQLDEVSLKFEAATSEQKRVTDEERKVLLERIGVLTGRVDDLVHRIPTTGDKP